MKIKTFISVLILSLFITVTPIFAKNEATSTPRTIRDQTKEERQEAKQKRIQVIYDAIKMGLEKRHTALLKIKDKLVARMDKNPMNRDPKSIETIKSKLTTDFTAAEAKYQTDLTALSTKFDVLKSSTKPSDLIKGLKDAVNLIRQDLNTIKKIIRDATVSLAQAPKLEITKTE